MLVDTGTPLTAYDNGMAVPTAHTGSFQLFSAETPPAQRLDLENVTLFSTPLRSVGPGAIGSPVGAILGGDNLQRFACTFDYRASAPTMSLTTIVTTCSCQLGDFDCQALFPFVLEGGQETLALGSNLYTYPSTRVTIDACLEPIVDPVHVFACPHAAPCPSTGQCPNGAACTDSCAATQDCPSAGTCNDGSNCDFFNVCATTNGALPPNPPYRTTGVDVKLIVATGFPGFAIGSAAYDRLRGSGAAAAALASGTRLHLPDPADDGADASGLPVGLAQLGGAMVTVDGTPFQTAALALVGRELYYGPCAELARSRRQRRTPAIGPLLRPQESGCLQRPGVSTDPQVLGCLANQSNADICNDQSPNNAVAAVIEIDRPVPSYVIDDASPVFASINADVRPTFASVEGIIGTEVLARLVTTIDYPNGRVIASCADGGCLTYPRLVQLSECGRTCNDSSAIAGFESPPAGQPVRPGGLCPGATP